MAHRVKQYRMDYETKGPNQAAILIGFALFLRIIYYFGLCCIENEPLKQLVMFLILPGCLEIGTIVLLRGVRLKLPLVHGIMGALYCILLLVQSLQCDNLLVMIIFICAYLICGALLIIVSLGLLSRGIAVASCFVTAVARFLLSGILGSRDLGTIFFEGCTMCVLCAWAYAALGMKEPE